MSGNILLGIDEFGKKTFWKTCSSGLMYLGKRRSAVVMTFIQFFIIILFIFELGYLGPGGLALDHREYDNAADCIGGATGYIDRLILGTKHIYGNPTAKGVYGAGAFDPEGILGVLFRLLDTQ